jgi:hypothetical protein
MQVSFLFATIATVLEELDQYDWLMIALLAIKSHQVLC